MFVGYHDTATLPFKRGQSVVIPAGAVVRAPTHPDRSRATKVLKRRQTVKIHHLMGGQSTNVQMFIGRDKRGLYPGFEAWFAVYDFAKEALDAIRHKDDDGLREKRLSLYRFLDQFGIPTQNPSVVWAGSGGYWCECEINTLLDGPAAVPSADDKLDELLEILA